MHVENRFLVAAYRFVIFALAIVGIWLEYLNFGFDFLRLFSGWFLVATAVFYFINLFCTFFRSQPNKLFFPMFQGALLVAGAALFMSQIAFYALDMPWTGVRGLASGLIYYILPILILLDWILFSVKGDWRIIDPLYWLAFPTIYVCYIITTATAMPDTLAMRCPYEFLDWQSIGIDTMLWQFAILALLFLVFGYICWLIDFAMSGKLSQQIVMPHIKMMVVDDQGNIITDDATETDEASTDADDMKATPEIVPVAKVRVDGLKDKKSANSIHRANVSKASDSKESQETKSSSARKKSSSSKGSSRPTKANTDSSSTADPSDTANAKKIPITKFAQPQSTSKKPSNKTQNKTTAQSAANPATKSKTSSSAGKTSTAKSSPKTEPKSTTEGAQSKPKSTTEDAQSKSKSASTSSQPKEQPTKPQSESPQSDTEPQAKTSKPAASSSNTAKSSTKTKVTTKKTRPSDPPKVRIIEQISPEDD